MNTFTTLKIAGALWLGLGAAATAGPAAPTLSADAVNNAQWTPAVASTTAAHPAMARAQVLLDRSFVSPGAIDGMYGGNMRKALRAFQFQRKLGLTGKLDRETWQVLTSMGSSVPALKTYTITQNDVTGPFLATMPVDFRGMAKLDRLAYTSVREQLAEKFHMDEDFLQQLNPDAKWDEPGTQLVVANIRDRAPAGEVVQLVVDKKGGAVKGYDPGGEMLVFYPASVGSSDFPSPSGTVKVNGFARDPVFTYTSKLNYANLKKGEALKIAPGPNNPVGVMWIDLNKPAYGIHGTPAPERVGKSASHGCVRLTNWDVSELAGIVQPGTPVFFVD